MLQLVERGFFKSAPIKLSVSSGGLPASDSPDVQVLRVGKFSHPKYGEFEITSATLAEMKANFDNKVRGVDIAFDYFHNSDELASGWPTELFLTEDGLSLWAKVDWTPNARKKLSDREIRYFSPDFAFKWQDPESGAVYSNVLFGGGLTNRPFVKDMAAIVAHETKGKSNMTPEQIKQLMDSTARAIKLAEDNADGMKKMQADQLAMKSHLEKLGTPAVHGAPIPPKAPKPAIPAAAAEPKLDEDGNPVDEDGNPIPPAAADDEDSDDPVVLKEQLAKVKAELAELSSAKKMAEKVSSFNVMLSEGKVCAAQKASFIKGDMKTFAKLAQPINLSMKGSGSRGGTTETTDQGDRDDQVLKLAEEKMKLDPKLGKIEAITLSNREIK